MIRTVQIIVTGKVQGVCFRAGAQKKAKQLGVEGWVKNLPDERVMLIARAESGLIDQLVAWCRRGPILAKVTDVVVEEVTASDLNTDFIIC